MVIEASRPRVLQGLGLDRETITVVKPQDLVEFDSIRSPAPMGQWVGFGDDVAISEGLLYWAANDRPEFIGDAVADPLSGTYAALAVAHAVSLGLSGMIDLPMAAVAGLCRRKVSASGPPWFVL